jgi:hypothetical protein
MHMDTLHGESPIIIRVHIGSAQLGGKKKGLKSPNHMT